MTRARDNPFANDRIEREIEFDPKWCSTSWPKIFEHWEKLAHRAAIVGPYAHLPAGSSVASNTTTGAFYTAPVG